MAHDAHKALENGKMHVCKYRTFPPEMADQIIKGLDPVLEVYKVLGLKYDPVQDTVTPAADKLGEYLDKPSLTKKQAAGLVARLFDPLGFTAPVTLKSKMLLQQIEKLHPKASWSTKLSEQESAPWHDYVKDVEQFLPTLQIPRLTRPAKYDKLRLCVFSDASAQAIAGVLYEVAEIDGKNYPCLASARNKVIPNKKRYTPEGVDTLTKDSLKINRLELTGALLAAQMAEQHILATQTKFDEVVAFTDSQVSCHWLWSDHEHHTEYVRSRVSAIKNVIPSVNWRHVPGKENPADLASRGCTMQELVNSEIWFRGPKWLSENRSSWPEIPPDAKSKLEEQLIDEQIDTALCCKVTTRSSTKKPHIKNVTPLIKPCSIPLVRIDQPMEVDSGYTSQASSEAEMSDSETPTSSSCPKTKKRSHVKTPHLDLSKVLDWDTLVRMRMRSSSKTQVSPIQALTLLLQEVQQEQLGNLYKHMQGTMSDRYLTDAQRNLKLQYGLIYDQSTNLIMSRSRNFRLDEYGKMKDHPSSHSSKRPGLAPIDHDLVFLTSEGPEVRALVRKFHEANTGHGSVNHVAAELRKNYWILQVRKLVKDVRRHCKDCQLLDAKALKQVEGSLPQCRYDTTRPESNVAFQAVGVDFVGPFFPYRDVHNRKHRRNKYKHPQNQHQDKQALIAVFSCAKTRAIHLEPVNDQSFPQFELAFRNFTARRGTPKVVFSDNAKTFKVANKLSVFTEEVAQKLKNQYEPDMQWIFNANRAPWWGGFFERMMRIIKEKLARNFYRHTFPTPDHFRAATASLEQFINSRPLTTFYSDRQESPPITPEMFLKPGPELSPFEFRPFSLAPFRTQAMSANEARHRRRAQLDFQERLWFDFQHIYLDNLRQFHKNTSSKNEAHKIKPGTCVLLTPDSSSFKPQAMLHKALWRRAKVVKMITGRDGRCRTVEIELSDKAGKVFRTIYPIQKLCPLELPDESKTEFLEVPNV
jgi:hypothetical protein